jgi:hypothetical protein
MTSILGEMFREMGRQIFGPAKKERKRPTKYFYLGEPYDPRKKRYEARQKLFENKKQADIFRRTYKIKPR